MQYVIVTGMSGAGKSTALRFLEDMGYFCIDNLPVALVPKFVDLVQTSTEIDKVALGIDARGAQYFDKFTDLVKEYKNKYNFTILFLETTDEILITRYKETRRNHPLARKDRLEIGIQKEREFMKEVKELSDFIVDTSYILPRQLKEKINDIFVDEEGFSSLMITILSFGFKYGIPQDSDLIFDVRFVPNPFYIPELKEKTGNDKEVSDYVLSFDVTTDFMDKLDDMIEFLIPHYVVEGKNQLVISIGCTGGKHRSVTLANELYNILQNKGQSVIIKHKDILKN